MRRRRSNVRHHHHHHHHKPRVIHRHTTAPVVVRQSSALAEGMEAGLGLVAGVGLFILAATIVGSASSGPTKQLPPKTEK